MRSLLAVVSSISAFALLPKPILAALPRHAANQFTVDTSNGPITGHPAVNASDVVEYLGIPYAQPPLGDLRFAPPVKYSGDKPYVASHWVCVGQKSVVERLKRLILCVNRDSTVR